MAEALKEIRAVLQSAAETERVLTYADLAREASTFIDLGPRSPELARLLCDLLIEDATNSHPLLASLVINRQTGRPGKGFFRLARHYYRFSDDEQFWLDELKSTYAFFGGSKNPTLRKNRVMQKTRPANTSEAAHILSFFD
jgi:hypothetical protein